VPAYQAPCKVDTDCGPAGFTCEDIQTCDFGAVEPQPDEPAGRLSARDRFSKCVCKPTGEKYCTEGIPVATIGSCPADWSVTIRVMRDSCDDRRLAPAEGSEGGAPRAGGAAPAICKTQDERQGDLRGSRFLLAPPRPMCTPKDWLYAYAAGADGTAPPYVTRNFNAQSLGAPRPLETRETRRRCRQERREGRFELS